MSFETTRNLIKAIVGAEVDTNEYRDLLFACQTLITFANDLKYILQGNRAVEQGWNDRSPYSPKPGADYVSATVGSLKDLAYHLNQGEQFEAAWRLGLPIQPEDDHQIIAALRADLAQEKERSTSLDTEVREIRDEVSMAFQRLRDEVDLILAAPLSKKEARGTLSLLIDRIDQERGKFLNHWSDIPF